MTHDDSAYCRVVRLAKPVRTNNVSCHSFAGKLPARKYQDAGMALESCGKNFRSFDSHANSIVLDGRDGSLRNSGHTGELALAQLLKFAENSYGFAYRDFGTLLGGSILFHFITSDSHGRLSTPLGTATSQALRDK